MDFKKQFDVRKLARALLEQNTLFWHGSHSEEERDFRLARFGLKASVVLLALIGAAEFVFLLIVVYYFLK